MTARPSDFREGQAGRLCQEDSDKLIELLRLIGKLNDMLMRLA